MATGKGLQGREEGLGGEQAHMAMWLLAGSTQHSAYNEQVREHLCSPLGALEGCKASKMGTAGWSAK